jgi:hypothetical protein
MVKENGEQELGSNGEIRLSPLFLKEFLLTNRDKSIILKSKTKRREFMVR